MNEERSNLGAELIGSVAESNLADIATDLSETALDSFLEDGIAKDIPLFGWLVKLHRAQRSIRDRLFLKKIAAFYVGAGEASPDERATFRKKIEADKAYQKKVGENLLLLIERHERFEKSLLLGRLFASLMRGHLTNEVFMRLAATLDKAVLEDLEALNKHKEQTFELSDHEMQGLYRCGLMDVKISVGGLPRDLVQMGIRRGYEMDRDGDLNYTLNELGEMFIQHALDPSKTR